MNEIVNGGWGEASSGDFDGRVPTTGTRAWISQLGIQVKKPWYPWVHGGPRESNTGGGQVSYLSYSIDFMVFLLDSQVPKHKR